MERQGLIVINGHKTKSSGGITRRRDTETGIEQSIIELVLISDDLEEHLESFTVDEEQNLVMTDIRKTKNNVKVTHSDHKVLITKFKVQWNRKVRKERKEIFNLKNKECQQIFKENTTKDKKLSKAAEEKEDLEIATASFLTVLDTKIKQSFKIIRIKDNHQQELKDLYKKRNELRTKKDRKSIEELKQVKAKLCVC